MKTNAISRKGRNEHLTVQEEEALCHYVEQKCKNRKQAFMRAGFSEKGSYGKASALLKTKKAKDFIAKKLEYVQ